MSHPRVLNLCAALAATTLLAACTSSQEPAAETTPTTAPVAQDLAALTLARGDFCDRIDQLVLREGVPVEPGTGHSLVAWTNGDRIEGATDGELSHEYGCRWRAAESSTPSPSSTPSVSSSPSATPAPTATPESPRSPDSPAAAAGTAAAWVFAPPFTPARAASAGKALRTGACRPLAGAAAGFGVAAVALTCAPAGKPTLVRWAGLFGDAWLVCETTGQDAAVRAAAFCPALVTAVADGSTAQASPS